MSEGQVALIISNIYIARNIESPALRFCFATGWMLVWLADKFGWLP